MEEGRIPKELNAHWNVGSAEKRSDDKKKGGGWLFGGKCKLGEQKGDLVVLCNHESVEREQSTFFLEDSTLYLDLCPIVCWQCVRSAALV